MSTQNDWDFGHTKIYPLTFQSRGISFPEWVSLFTLALAPLIAHIIAGAPEPSYLCKRRPKWHERISHYNPTSILWRYAAIADRRIRANAWDPSDMAASNALFWTAEGWDGSEAMVDTSLPQCNQLPAKSRIRIFSVEMLKTLIVTLQGAQAMTLIALGAARTTSAQSVISNMAVDFVFFPIALLGVLRLPAGLWLTEHFVYGASFTRLEEHNLQIYQHGSYVSKDGLLDSPAIVVENRRRFRPCTFWPSILFRVFFTLFLLGLPTMLGVYILPWAGAVRFTTTNFVVCMFYLMFTLATAAVFIRYLAVGATSTVVPCINSVWYKAYTMMLGILALGMIIVACIETRKTPCGKYTSFSGSEGDLLACWSSNTEVWFLDPDRYHNFGIARTVPQEYDQGTLDSKDFWVYNFTGVCLGKPIDPTGQLVVMEAANLGQMVSPEAT
ncbi:hypothetical protein BKA67DRAFT_661416 [Truncatella angustata]|uniref:Uncharacterized protein n=1 Tax=Truncatella angustata TaxID=152316 RepID=A0A9P8ZT91_9PEZI|nr:uncharacterized protein BKA67DRAFT_661416 [Truncatella angustata]KAH6648441.1 hypothetical protein BKA67DRAFT_661416 [Truncatella angustata]